MSLDDADPTVLRNVVADLQNQIDALRQQFLDFQSLSEAAPELGDVIVKNVIAGDGNIEMGNEGIAFTVDGVFVQAGTDPDLDTNVRVTPGGNTRVTADGNRRITYNTTTFWNYTFLGTLYHNKFVDGGAAYKLFGNHAFGLGADLFMGRLDFEAGDFSFVTVTGSPQIVTDAPVGNYSASVDKDNYFTASVSAVSGSYYLLMMKAKGPTKLRVGITNGGVASIDVDILSAGWAKFPILILAGGTPITISFKSDTSGTYVGVDDIRLYRAFLYTATSAGGQWGLGEGNIVSINNGAPGGGSARTQFVTGRAEFTTGDGTGAGWFKNNGYPVNDRIRTYFPNLTIVNNAAETQVAASGSLVGALWAPITGAGRDVVAMQLFGKSHNASGAGRTIVFTVYANNSGSLSLVATLPVINIASATDPGVLLWLFISIDPNDRDQILVKASASTWTSDFTGGGNLPAGNFAPTFVIKATLSVADANFSYTAEILTTQQYSYTG